jgi:hypothetical protein
MENNKSEQEKSLLKMLELLWWVVTLVIIFAVSFPIVKHLGYWKYLGLNIFFIVTLITLTRYIFLIEHTFIAQRQRLKVGLILFMFPFAFTVIHFLNKFMNYIEEHSWEPITGQLPINIKAPLENYMWGEMLFFGVGSVMVCAAFAVKMFKSVWMLHNRGKA